MDVREKTWGEREINPELREERDKCNERESKIML
jgi:hypothetical protein